MNPHRRISSLAVAGIFGVAALAPMSALAQATYPNKPIRIVVPFPAGTSPDVVARLFADRMAQGLGQPLMIDNRVGAAGMIAAENVARSAPDGYSLLWSVNSLSAFNPHLYAKLPYDALKDFAPVSQVVKVPYFLIARTTLEANNAGELAAYTRTRPGQLNWASSGVGTGPHVVMEYLSSMSGLKGTHVPFKTTGLAEIMSGQMDYSFEASTTAVGAIKSGRVKALGISSSARSPILPDVPAIGESVNGFEAEGWQGVLAPAGTPRPIIEKLNAELVRVANLPEIQQRLKDMVLTPLGTPVADFERLYRDDYEKWGKVIRSANIRVE